MDDYDTDDELISFWNLRRIEAERAEDQWAREHLFGFADWSLQAQVWYVQLSSDEATNTVFVTAAYSLEPVASSFAEFIEKYLSDPMSVWPP